MQTLTPPSDPCLWQKTEDVHLALLPFVLEQAGRMRQMMVTHGGVGLAATQVSIPMRFFVTNGRHLPSVVINPVIEDQADLMEAGEESCLTWPGEKAVVVKRPRWIVATYLNAMGTQRTDKFIGYAARIFMHKTDHLNGICIFPKP